MKRQSQNSPLTRLVDYLRSGQSRLLRPILLALVIIILFPLSTKLFCIRIEPGQIGVRQDNVFGTGIAERDFGPGYHLRLLGIHRYYVLDERFSFLHFLEDTVLSIRTRDNNVVTLDVTIPFRIRPGEGYQLVRDGLHVGDAYMDRTRNTTIGVLRSYLADMSAPSFFDTEERLRVTDSTLSVLNTALDAFHVEAERIYVRSVFYRDEYENQLQRIQLLQQEALLDQAQQLVSLKQQELDNYNQGTAALENSRNAWWDQQLAVLDRVYNVGYQTADLPFLVDAALVVRNIVDDPLTEIDETQAHRDTVTLETQQHFQDEVYSLGIEGINAVTNRAVAELEGRASALQSRYQAQADQVIAEIISERDRRINELLSSAGGRALVALEAAERVQFGENLVFAADTLPFILNLDHLASVLMGISR